VLAVLRSPPRWWRWRGLGVEPHRSAGQYRLIRLRCVVTYAEATPSPTSVWLSRFQMPG